jgi:hypothetical protein
MKKRWKIALFSFVLVIILAGIISSIYYLFVYINLCQTETCFAKAVTNCKKASYISDKEEMITKYTIKGRGLSYCKVEVEILRIKKGETILSSLDGKSMECKITLNTYSSPENDLSLCSGLLKEKLQEIIIERMHKQLLENIGKINEEATKIL